MSTQRKNLSLTEDKINNNPIYKILIEIQCVFFIGSKVFVYLTQLKLLQIGQTYLKFFVLLEHLIKVHLEYQK